MGFMNTATELYEHLIKMSGKDIPNSVNELVEIVVRQKKSDYEFEFYKENTYLPKGLQVKNLEQKILSLNKELIKMSNSFNFDRVQEIELIIPDEEEKQNDNIDEEKNEVLISFCLAHFSDEEYNEYLNYDISYEDLKTVRNWYRRKFGKKFEITLPKFELVTDYLGLMGFYDSLIEDFDYLNEVDDNSISILTDPSKKYHFVTKMNEKQILVLYENLIINEFIDKDTDKLDFLWAFGIENSRTEIDKIKWTTSNNLAVYFIDMLYENKLLKEWNRMWAIGSNIFGINNMAQIKQNYLANIKTEGKPKNFEKIDYIISLI